MKLYRVIIEFNNGQQISAVSMAEDKEKAMEAIRERYNLDRIRTGWYYNIVEINGAIYEIRRAK